MKTIAGVSPQIPQLRLQGDDAEAERARVLVEIIDKLKSAIERARESGLVDLVFQLGAVLEDAERELAALGKLNRRASTARRGARAAARSRVR